MKPVKTAVRLFLPTALACLAFFFAAYAPLEPARAASPAQLRLLAFGDSLTAGHGLGPEEGFCAQMEKRLQESGYDVKVINAGVSGDTSAGGRSRLEWALVDEPHGVIVELGANDGLRRLSVSDMEANLDFILERLAKLGLPVLLAGMRMGDNIGEQYSQRFAAVFPRLAKKHGALFYPFFLQGVAGNPRFNQPDGIHPNAKGVAIIVQQMLPKVEELIGLARLARLGGQ